MTIIFVFPNHHETEEMAQLHIPVMVSYLITGVFLQKTNLTGDPTDFMYAHKYHKSQLYFPSEDSQLQKCQYVVYLLMVTAIVCLIHRGTVIDLVAIPNSITASNALAPLKQSAVEERLAIQTIP